MSVAGFKFKKDFKDAVGSAVAGFSALGILFGFAMLSPDSGGNGQAVHWLCLGLMGGVSASSLYLHGRIRDKNLQEHGIRGIQTPSRFGLALASIPLACFAVIAGNELCGGCLSSGLADMAQSAFDFAARFN
tara:strand:- start:1004 stop:1399 length:396 start_codon:yes stop_codon:yes gene_type:complete